MALERVGDICERLFLNPDERSPRFKARRNGNRAGYTRGDLWALRQFCPDVTDANQQKINKNGLGKVRAALREKITQQHTP